MDNPQDTIIRCADCGKRMAVTDLACPHCEGNACECPASQRLDNYFVMGIRFLVRPKQPWIDKHEPWLLEVLNKVQSAWSVGQTWFRRQRVLGFILNILGGILTGFASNFLLSMMSLRIIYWLSDLTLAQECLWQVMISLVYWPLYRFLRPRSPSFAAAFALSGSLSVFPMCALHVLGQLSVANPPHEVLEQ